MIVFAVSIATAFAQGSVQPRDADEEQAWRLYNQYKESKRIAAELDATIKAKFKDAYENAVGGWAIAGVDWEANSEAKAKVEKLALERKRQADLLAAWEKKYYWRYGDLRWTGEKIYDAKSKQDMDRIEFALTYFPFNYEPGKRDAPDLPGTSTQGSFTAEKGSAEAWSHLRVTVGSVANFKTDDRPGWRNNGTGFSAMSIGTNPVTIRIDITGKAGVSYFDYTSAVSVKTSDGKTLLAEKPVISKDGGNRSYSVVWNPDLNPGNLTVSVSIAGGNPEGFIYFVVGSISVGRGLTPSNAGTLESPTAATPAGSFSGRWTGTYHNSLGDSGQSTLTLKEDGDKITGDFDGLPITNANRDGAVVRWSSRTESNGKWGPTKYFVEITLVGAGKIKCTYKAESEKGNYSGSIDYTR